MNNKKITFFIWIILLIAIIILVTIKNVYASELTYPAYGKIDGVHYVASEMPTVPTTDIIKYTSSSNHSFNVSIEVTYDLIEDYEKYPFVWIYFKSGAEDLKVYRNSTCNTTCFSNDVAVKRFGYTTWNGYNAYLYALVLSADKVYYDSNRNMYIVNDIITFYSSDTDARAYDFDSFIISSDDAILGYANDIEEDKTQNIILNMQNVISGSLNTLNNSIDQGWANFQAQDLDNSDKVPPGTQEFEDYEDIENDLFDAMNNADISDMDIAIDVNSSTWVWDRITEWLNSNNLMMTFFISILSVGIIKMGLGR